MPKTSFQWVRDADEPVTPRRERPTRQERRKPAGQADRLTEALLKLKPLEWSSIPLGPVTLRELREYHRIKPSAHGALRRQKLRLSAIIRTDDMEAIEEAMGLTQTRTTQREEQLHDLQRWRTRMIEEGDDVVQAFIEDYPTTDRQRLRQLLRQLRKKRDQGQKTTRLGKQVMALLREAAAL